MKTFIVIIAVLGFVSCKQNHCEKCIQYVVGPDLSTGNTRRDTIYADKSFCGDDLKDETKKNGEYKEVTVGGNRKRWTTIVQCR